MPSGKCNSITAKAMGSLFNITLTGHVFFGIPQHVQCILQGLTDVLLCVQFIFADSERCRIKGSA